MNNKYISELNNILMEYSQLPEYSGMECTSVNTISLFSDYPINIAATRGIIRENLILLLNGAYVNASGEHGYTPLHNATEQGHMRVVRLLLKFGADLTLKTDGGDTPLDLALILEEYDIYLFLKNIYPHLKH